MSGERGQHPAPSRGPTPTPVSSLPTTPPPHPPTSPGSIEWRRYWWHRDALVAHLSQEGQRLQDENAHLSREGQRLQGENARLSRWKYEATTVIEDWEAVFDSLVAPRVTDADLGKSKSVLTAKEIIRLSVHNGELLARIEELEATQ